MMERIRGIIEEGPALPPGAMDDVSLAIERVLSTMPDRQREVAEHRLRHQRTTEEIARVMRLAPATVEQHIRRITAVLRTDLPAMLR